MSRLNLLNEQDILFQALSDTIELSRSFIFISTWRLGCTNYYFLHISLTVVLSALS